MISRCSSLAVLKLLDIHSATPGGLMVLSHLQRLRSLMLAPAYRSSCPSDIYDDSVAAMLRHMPQLHFVDWVRQPPSRLMGVLFDPTALPRCSSNTTKFAHWCCIKLFHGQLSYVAHEVVAEFEIARQDVGKHALHLA